MIPIDCLNIGIYEIFWSTCPHTCTIPEKGEALKVKIQIQPWRWELRSHGWLPGVHLTVAVLGTLMSVILAQSQPCIREVGFGEDQRG